jgi:hypothetical protein
VDLLWVNITIIVSIDVLENSAANSDDGSPIFAGLDIKKVPHDLLVKVLPSCYLSGLPLWNDTFLGKMVVDILLERYLTVLVIVEIQ